MSRSSDRRRGSFTDAREAIEAEMRRVAEMRAVENAQGAVAGAVRDSRYFDDKPLRPEISRRGSFTDTREAIEAEMRRVSELERVELENGVSAVGDKDLMRDVPRPTISRKGSFTDRRKLLQAASKLSGGSDGNFKF